MNYPQAGKRQQQVAGVHPESVHEIISQRREQKPHCRIDQKGVQLGGKQSHNAGPDPGMARLYGQPEQYAHQKSEQGPGPHAQQQAAQGIAAQKWGKELIRGHHIVGRSLVKAGQAKENPHGRGGTHAQKTARDQDGEIGSGDGNGLNVDVAQKREGHQKFNGRQGRKQITI